MSILSPKPIIAGVIQTWSVPPGMTIALVEDMERQLWIVESCPAGTHFWTLAQARTLTHTGHVGSALRAAMVAAQKLPVSSKPVSKRTNAPAPLAIPILLPDKAQKREQRLMETSTQTSTNGLMRPLRRATRRTDKVAVCS